MPHQAFDIREQFVVLSPDKQASAEPVNADLYARLNQQYDGFKGHELLSVHTFQKDWNQWERHPHGDEVVMLLRGKVTFVLRLDAGEVEIQLENVGDTAIVPRGVWHTARTQSISEVLFLTPGEGTEHEAG